VYRLTAKAESAKPGRKGLLKCKYCRKQFTVTVEQGSGVRPSIQQLRNECLTPGEAPGSSGG
jgi:hypothetical protein